MFWKVSIFAFGIETLISTNSYVLLRTSEDWQ